MPRRWQRYRFDIARQQTTYNQPGYTSFHLGSDMRLNQEPLHQPEG